VNEQHLYELILNSIKERNEFLTFFDEDEGEIIELVRSLGRRAGRELGWKISTFATDPDRREDRKVIVLVSVTRSSPLRDELFRIRGLKQCAATIDKMGQ